MAGGTCQCSPGFTGAACDRVACDDECNGRGTCEPLWKLGREAVVNGEAKEYAYGNPDPNQNGKDTWDRDMFQSCLCDGFSPEKHRQGPSSTYISGIYVDEPRVLGYHGHACEKALCPFGDDPSTEGVNEKQTVGCSFTSGTFTLTFRDQTTAAIGEGKGRGGRGALIAA